MNFTYPGICSSASENGMFMWSFIKNSINLSNWLSNLFFLNLYGYGAIGFSSTNDSFTSTFFGVLGAKFFNNFSASSRIYVLFFSPPVKFPTSLGFSVDFSKVFPLLRVIALPDFFLLSLG